MTTKHALTLSTIATLAMLALAGCKEPAQKTEGKADTGKKYTCEMHPEYVSDHPGKCPKCNMELVEKK